MFKKILIANRGEIACRVIKTAKPHGHCHGRRIFRGGPRLIARALARMRPSASVRPRQKTRTSSIDKIIEACKQTGAEAVHPGYGFLSENQEFSKRLEENGIIFIGPKHYSVAAMGDKIESKKLAIAAKRQYDSRLQRRNYPQRLTPLKLPGASAIPS
jgi:propionyl-CoA carboxylase alpha chain